MQVSMPENDGFEREFKVMGAFIENAKTYVQLSTGALFLTVTFLHEILGIPQGQKLVTDSWLVLSWLCFLVAIISGALYQYFAAKFLEWKSGVHRSHRVGIRCLAEHPWPPYGVMLVSFYLGAIFFTVAAIKRI